MYTKKYKKWDCTLRTALTSLQCSNNWVTFLAESSWVCIWSADLRLAEASQSRSGWSWLVAAEPQGRTAPHRNGLKKAKQTYQKERQWDLSQTNRTSWTVSANKGFGPHLKRTMSEFRLNCTTPKRLKKTQIFLLHMSTKLFWWGGIWGLTFKLNNQIRQDTLCQLTDLHFSYPLWNHSCQSMSNYRVIAY